MRVNNCFVFLYIRCLWRDCFVFVLFPFVDFFLTKMYNAIDILKIVYFFGVTWSVSLEVNVGWWVCRVSKLRFFNACNFAGTVNFFLFSFFIIIILISWISEEITKKKRKSTIHVLASPFTGCSCTMYDVDYDPQHLVHWICIGKIVAKTRPTCGITVHVPNMGLHALILKIYVF